MTRLVVFDLGGVVCAHDPQPRLEVLATATGLPAATIHERIWASGIDELAEEGAFDRDETYRAVLEALEGRVQPKALRAMWATAFTPNRDVLDIVDTLPQPVAMLTNNGPIVEDCLDHELAEVGRRFSCLFSWRLKACKPAPAAFERAAQHLGADGSRLLLIDDSPANVAAARAAGWEAIEFSDAAQLRQLLLTTEPG